LGSVGALEGKGGEWINFGIRMGNSCVVDFMIREDGASIDRGNNERVSIHLSMM
jgi:hypothetical protein